MNNFFLNTLENLSTIDNTLIFSLSIIPYSIFLFYLYKINILNRTVKLGFSLTILFVLITIALSILSLNYFGRTLVEIDSLHGAAEFFLTLSDFIILLGFLRILRFLEVNNS